MHFNFNDYVNKHFGGPVGLDDLTDEDYDNLYNEWEALRKEIKEKLIDPAEKHGMSDSKSNKIAERIAKKYRITAYEVFEIYWDM